MATEFRILTEADKDDILELFSLRKNMMLNSSIAVNDHKIALNDKNENFFDHRIVCGLYEDGQLQCMVSNSIIWEIDFIEGDKLYTRLILSRPYNTPQPKTKEGLPIRMYNLLNYSFSVMEKNGYYSLIDIISADPKWIRYDACPKHRTSDYNIKDVAYLPAGETFRNILFMKYMTTRRYDIPLKVVYRWLPEDKR